ncbi:MAG TPA: TlyA family RNA methyltransferase [Candidatus Eremiobacteraceae bacterium]|nr:TlyA family RNA methyltransferase [Candidatus Eremiobacteraceae bacterium]
MRKCKSGRRCTIPARTTTPARTTDLTKSPDEKRRLDVAVAQRLGCSRRRAQALILAGKVRVGANGESRKAGSLVTADETIAVEEEERFVGRGASKLEKALDDFGWQVEGLRCLDVGASTGGFTDSLLQRGAASVSAVDVGYGQLAWKLRTDPRVTVHERCNFRHADVRALGAPFAFACVDVSFISIAKLAPNLAAALETGGRLVALIKPQFEVGRAAVGKGGVVRDPVSHVNAIESVIVSLRSVGLVAACLTHSPIKGPAGNIEFLLGAIRKSADSVAEDACTVDAAGAVQRAHEALAR